jgi:hypothetical protein
MPPTKPPYPPEFRREAVELVRIAEKSIRQVAVAIRSAVPWTVLVITVQPLGASSAYEHSRSPLDDAPAAQEEKAGRSDGEHRDAGQDIESGSSS